ncbi:hypothetical protein SRHO_G00105990 [Serrasalmus rhombeus]
MGPNSRCASRGQAGFSLGALSASLCQHILSPCNSTNFATCSALAPDALGTTVASPVMDWYWHIARHNRRSADDDFPPPEHRLRSKAAKFWDCLFPQYGISQVWNQLEITHYRLATFTNATRTAIQGIRDELTALRLTAMQNRLALDLLLAKEGGVCAMVGDSCCTNIPANDEDHGSIATALDRMSQVSTQLQLDEHGGCLMDRVYALASSLIPHRSDYVFMAQTVQQPIYESLEPSYDDAVSASV